MRFSENGVLAAVTVRKQVARWFCFEAGAVLENIIVADLPEEGVVSMTASFLDSCLWAPPLALFDCNLQKVLAHS